jgi:predicted dehydrogenase
MSQDKLTRRQFNRAAAISIAGPAIISSPAAGRAAASDRITMGFIGIGMMGRGHLSRFLGYGDVQVVALSDVVKERLEHATATVTAKYGAAEKGASKAIASFADYQAVLSFPDLDAVLIATPDHWHAIPVIHAARAGLDIYCEKPLTHNVVEGRKMVEAIAKSKVIFQTGSQQRSEFGGRFRLAAELVRNGRLGKIHTVRIGVGDPSMACDLPDTPTPAGTDWDRWLGPAPARGFHQVLCPQGIHRHFPAWRKYWEYAGGAVADMGAHHFDIAQWALEMDHSGPVKIEPPTDGGKRGLKLTYASGIEMYHGGPADVTFEGELGRLEVSRGSIKTDPVSILETPIGDDDQRVYQSNDHRRNWIDCIKSRKQAICPAEVGHRSATLCHLTNIGYRLGRALKWNPSREQFINDREANGLLWRQPREDYDLI